MNEKRAKINSNGINRKNGIVVHLKNLERLKLFLNG